MTGEPLDHQSGAPTARGGHDLRRRNAAEVVRVLVERGATPRIDLADALALSTGAVTRITRELSSLGLLRELDPLASADAGRRRVPVDLEAERFLAVGVNIGYDDIIYGMVDLRGRLVEPARRAPQGSTDPGDTADQVVALVDELITGCPPASHIVGTGVSVGGAVERPSGMVTDPDVLGWFDVDVAGLLRGRLPGRLAVGTIYRALARAEAWFGAATDTKHFVHVFLRHAVGAAFVFNGADYHGANALAGNIAHWPVSARAVEGCSCGRPGCLTSVASLGAVLRRAHDAGLHVAAAAELAGLARNDERAARILHDRAVALGEVVGALVEALAPERIVVSAPAMTTSDLELVRSTARPAQGPARDLDEVIVPTALADPYDANVVGTATLALQVFYDDPLGHLVPARRGGDAAARG